MNCLIVLGRIKNTVKDLRSLKFTISIFSETVCLRGLLLYNMSKYVYVGDISVC